MASALQINAAGNIIAGHGIGVSSTLTNTVARYQNLPTVSYLKKIYTTLASTNSSISNLLYPTIDALGAGLIGQRFLLDLWPSNVTPISTSTVSYHHASVLNTASFSGTLTNQANWPITNQNSGFASVYLTVHSLCASKYDIIGAINVLQNKTYGQTGLDYTTPLDIATGGINTNGPLLANVVANWGTMYDINNMSLIADPYVFGHNLLNQNLGNYGGLNTKFTNAGLNVSDITKFPELTSLTYVQTNINQVSTAVGMVHLPIAQSVTIDAPVSGASATVMKNIYKTVVGSDLNAIINATGFKVGSYVKFGSLADFLNFKMVVNPGYINDLAAMGITDFPSLGSYLQRIVGKSTFTSWADMATFLSNIHVPSLTVKHGSTSGSAVVSSSAISSIHSALGTGKGNFSHRIITDYLGSMSGDPHVPLLLTIINNYPEIATQTESAMASLCSAVTSYINDKSAGGSPSLSPVTNAANAVKNAMIKIPNTTAYLASSSAFLNLISHLTTEVNNIASDNVSNTANNDALIHFSQSVANDAADSTITNSYQFFANVITNDSYGDSIRLAISETINTSKLNTAGVDISNNTSPATIVAQSTSLNVPVSTYISQNS